MLLIIYLIMSLIGISPLIFIKKILKLILNRNDFGFLWGAISFIFCFLICFLTLLMNSLDFYSIPFDYEKINQFAIENPNGCIIDSEDKIDKVHNILSKFEDYNHTLKFYKESYKENYYGWLWFFRPDTLIKYPEFYKQDTIINNQYVIKIWK